MPVWIVVGVCAAVFVMVIAVAGSFNLFNGGMPAASESEPRPGLPADFAAADIAQLRFSPALRGYRPDEVDAALDALHDRIAQLEAGREPAAGADGVEEPVGQAAGEPGAEPAAEPEGTRGAAAELGDPSEPAAPADADILAQVHDPAEPMMRSSRAVDANPPPL
ncbi:DivIVA domain-containing protein [Brevibacterium sp. 5221]|uniref:DivIVA domain-containing protein n=1 Tax=Brevibacterium rongguiense TaxID=2695267 RepID=A0A6N9HAP5_9MICO|nr:MULTISPECIES: DivIVA domain-containing protein [Brevibacterium]MYM20801.1 DivIVA domain-containing protein [Brevibacterium rongguiense]WAL40479.1 DivIVA domain-containing protein [Brevibacterium sp. BRM-1]